MPQVSALRAVFPAASCRNRASSALGTSTVRSPRRAESGGRADSKSLSLDKYKYKHVVIVAHVNRFVMINIETFKLKGLNRKF